MPFSSEEVARAVAAMPVPVVTGVGHEPDTCIADMVSDLRASTPTAAAEAVAPSIDELGKVLERERRLAGPGALAHRAGRRAPRASARGAAGASDRDAVLGPAAQALDRQRSRWLRRSRDE